ncbi:unnamed protein product [Protopolystoma xenopodis]|uniref:Uncharacterized protein n=1 Tax=Protopolystoma xenopodis TaxID=117903 RepID=A0A448X3N8_9PLAT|nr:unnamed protein product [Protopolystoma xenopodis]
MQAAATELYVTCIFPIPTKVFPGLVLLRKICNHPDLVTGGPRLFGSVSVDEEAAALEQELLETEAECKARRHRKRKYTSNNLHEEQQDVKEREVSPMCRPNTTYYPWSDFGCPRRSTKMIVVDALLKNWKDQANKVLQYKKVSQP